MILRPLFAELRKRKVVRAAAIYGAIAWGVTEVVVTIVEQLFLPQWVSTLATIFFVVGFPVAMFLSWTFDFTAEGIERTTVASRRGTASIVMSVVLLIAGTTGLFFLIKPSLQDREAQLAAAPMVAANSVAVLPFVNVGGDPGDSYLVVGLSDELRDQLARVSGLRIAARSSSVAALEQGLDAGSMAAKLGVAKWVEGTVRRQGNLLTVSVQLIDSSNGLALWTETFKRGPQELLNIQQAIAETVVRYVLPGAAGVVPEPATRDPAANELMLEARHLEHQVRERLDVDRATLLQAIRLYRKASEVDPESALAHSRLAGALIYLGELDAAEAPIFRALSLGPGLSEVQNSLGEFYWARGRVREAGAAWARAIELDADNPDALANRAYSLWLQGQTDDVPELYRRALALDPLSIERYAALGTYLALESHIDEAREVVSEVERLFDGAAAYRVIAELHDMLGDVDVAIAWAIRARDLEPNNPLHVYKLAEYHADIGDFDTALRLDPNGIGILFKMRRYQEMIDLAEFAMIEQPGDLQIRTLLAIAYNALGAYESALHVLGTAGLPESDFSGWRSTEHINGYVALQNALYGFGRTDMARELVMWAVEIGYSESFDWWINTNEACARAILGQDELAREALEDAQHGLHLPWDPILKDSPCFERFEDDPVYRNTLHYYDGRRAMLLERLPTTLAEFGVEL